MSLEDLKYNKKEIISNTIIWIKENHRDRTNKYDKCERDISLVIDAYIADLENFTIKNTINIASNYWKDGVRQINTIDTEIEAHIRLVEEINSRFFMKNLDLQEHLLLLKNNLINVIKHGPVSTNNSNYSYLNKYQYPMEYDTQAYIDPELINEALYEAWLTTPSKQNMMPYNVFVIGPENQKIKDLLYYKSLTREYKTNHPRYDVDEKDPVALEKAMFEHRSPPQYLNFNNAPYILIFCQRVEDKLNPWNEFFANQGHNFEQTKVDDYKRAEKLALIEMGMFSAAFSNACLKHGIDISHTRCLPTELKFWQEPEFSFIKYPPQLIMTAGKGKVYRRQYYKHCSIERDHKPDFDRVVVNIK